MERISFTRLIETLDVFKRLSIHSLFDFPLGLIETLDVFKQAGSNKDIQ